MNWTNSPNLQLLTERLLIVWALLNKNLRINTDYDFVVEWETNFWGIKLSYLYGVQFFSIQDEHFFLQIIDFLYLNWRLELATHYYTFLEL